MNLFIHDIPVVIRPVRPSQKESRYDSVIDAKKEAFTSLFASQRIWIKNATARQTAMLLRRMHKKADVRALTVDITGTPQHLVIPHLKNDFKIVQAAGGVVQKSQQTLLIRRWGKWDLPKGKKEPGETFAQTAQREIEEECRVDAIPTQALCATWHTYTLGNEHILKQTRWYILTLKNDRDMQPLKEEDIEQVLWVNTNQAADTLKNSYRSIRFVYKKYLAQRLGMRFSAQIE